MSTLLRLSKFTQLPGLALKNTKFGWPHHQVLCINYSDHFTAVLSTSAATDV